MTSKTTYLFILFSLAFSFYIPFSHADQLFVTTVNGTNVSADWSAIPEAESYTLYYAYADYNGDVDMDTLGTIEMGQEKTIFEPNLPSGVVFYTAVMAHTSQGDILSNIESFMPFGGTVTFPETSDALMSVDDTGGIGNISVIGTKNNNGSIAAISKITGNDGSGAYTLNISNDKPVSYIKDEVTTNFIYNNDGSVSFTTSTARTVAYRANDTLNCEMDRNKYYETLYQSRGNKFTSLVFDKANKQGFPVELFKSLVKTINYILKSDLNIDNSNIDRNDIDEFLRSKLAAYVNLMYQSLEGVVDDMMIEYDEQCKEEDTSSSDSSNSTADIVIDTSCPIPGGAEYKQFEDSTVLLQYYLLNKQQVGSYKSWKTGDDDALYLSYEKCMNSEGQLNGWDIKYNDNETINLAIHYKNDLKDGHQYDFYFKTDSLYVDNTFKNGENTHREIWYEDGTIKTYCDFTITKIEDRCTHY